MNPSHNYRGTFRVIGMLEGPLFDFSQSLNNEIDNWIKLANHKGLDVDLECGNGKFSLLFKGKLIRTDDFKNSDEDIEQILTFLLNELINELPVEIRCDFFSTIRSIEHRSDTEIQTVYAINNKGSIEPRSKCVDITTIPSPFEKSSKKTKRNLILFTVIFCVVIFFISQFSRDYFFQIIKNRVNNKITDLSIDFEFFNGYLKVNSTTIKQNVVNINLSKDKLWIGDEIILNDFKLSDHNLNQILCILSLKKGYIGLDLYDKNGKFILREQVRIKDIFDDEQSELNLEIKLPKIKQVHKIVFCPV